MKFTVSGVSVLQGKGLEMSETLPDLLSIEKQEDGTLRVRKLLNSRKADKMHGLFR